MPREKRQIQPKLNLVLSSSEPSFVKEARSPPEWVRAHFKLVDQHARDLVGGKEAQMYSGSFLKKEA